MPRKPWDGVERRSRERHGLIEQYVTLSYNALRQHMPETMGEKPRAMAHAA